MTDKDPETPTEEPRAAKPRTPWQKSERVRLVLFVLATLLALGVVALVGRLRRTLAIDEPLAKVESLLRRKHQPKRLREMRAACKRPTCDCAAMAATFALDADGIAQVNDLVRAADACTEKSKFEGFRIEALARKQLDAQAMVEAKALLAKEPNNPNALYAQALAYYRVNESEKAKSLAERALASGRGSPAQLLIGLMAYNKGDFAGARRSFEEMLRTDPDDIDALYNFGVVAQKEGRYGPARSSFLSVTRLNPKHFESRYNLAILAHSIGAEDEARHHLEKLRAVAPKDARLRDLEAALAVPPPNLPRHVLTIGTEQKASPSP